VNGAALKTWLDRQLAWPLGQQQAAFIMIPLITLALPIAGREKLLTTETLLWSYGAFAAVAATAWVLLCVGSIARQKEAFYQKYERPLLSKEYQDG
jgi:hypothetical protein